MKVINDKMTRFLGNQVLVLKKQSPHLLFGAGVAGVVTSTVLACRATLKLDSKLDEIQGRVADIKVLAHSRTPEDRTPVIKNRDREVARVYIRGVYDVSKLYAPAVIIGAASIACLTQSHMILTRRYTGAVAAYSALQTAFENYRERVRKEIGEEKEQELYYGLALDPTGKELSYALPQGSTPGSPYARFFDEYNKNWEKSAEKNHFFISCQQNYANHLLRARGHVFLQEVYDMLGIERTPAAQVVGWLYEAPEGDGYIDFGLFDNRNTDFINGRERSILLDFNVDGIIYDKI